MDYNPNQYGAFSQERKTSRAQYVAQTFLRMFFGLLSTFGVSLLGIGTGLFRFVYVSPAIFFTLAAAELIFVFVLSARITTLKPATAKLLFFVYAALNGVTISSVFLIYELGSTVMLFGMATLFFGIMAAFGYFTKNDLSHIGKIALFGICALALFWVLSLFFNLSAMETVVCFIGLGLFLAITAYDTQKIKKYYEVYQSDEAMLQKASIISALQIYLDFINIFLYLLRLLGKRR